nr:M23 family metallopeptidase [Phaeobacter gallaeciensis]
MEKIDRRILPDENSQSISLPFDISSTSNADGSNNNRVQVNSSPISPDATHSGKYNWDFAFDGITITSILPNQVSTAEYFWSEAEGSDLGDGITLGHTVDGGFFYSTYAHFQAGSVTVSDSNPFDNNYQTVEGEALGVSGDTGFGSGPHLHLQITPLFDNREELRANNPLVIGGSFGASVASPVKFDTALGVVLDGVVSIQNIDLSTDTSALRTPGGKIVDANIFLISDDAIDATGNDDENILSGNSGNNVIAGLGGADAIWGGQGNDEIYGEGGNTDTDNDTVSPATRFSAAAVLIRSMAVRRETGFTATAESIDCGSRRHLPLIAATACCICLPSTTVS